MEQHLCEFSIPREEQQSRGIGIKSIKIFSECVVQEVRG